MRLAIISDIHEDIDSLRRILQKAESKGYDQLVCLGDISGYSLPYYKYDNSRNAVACLALLREKCNIVIAGNHDLHAAGRNPDLPEEIKDHETWQHEDDRNPGYSKEDIRYLLSLPTYEVLHTPDFNILFSHYAYPNLSGFVKGFYTRKKEFEPHFSFMQEHGCSLGFTGHAHPRGFYKVQAHGFRQYGYRRIPLSSLPAIIGISPVTRNDHLSGFCIFDTHKRRLQALR